jgi:Tfp pilus assembly protein PilX
MNIRANYKFYNAKPHKQNGVALFISLVFLLVATILGVSSLQANIFSEKMTRNNIQREEALEAAEMTLLEAETLIDNNARQIMRAVFQDNGESINWNDYNDSGIQNSNPGDTCEGTLNGVGGLCIPYQEWANFNDGDKYYDNWVEVVNPDASRDQVASLGVWSDDGKHRKASDVIKNKYGLAESPKYIIEFMGNIPDVDSAGEVFSNCGSPSDADGGAAFIDSQANWPHCMADRKLFRITAIAQTGNKGQTRVMLQSLYIAAD